MHFLIPLQLRSFGRLSKPSSVNRHDHVFSCQITTPVLKYGATKKHLMITISVSKSRNRVILLGTNVMILESLIKQSAVIFAGYVKEEKTSATIVLSLIKRQINGPTHDSEGSLLLLSIE